MRLLAFQVCRPTLNVSRDLHCDLLVDLEEQRQAVKPQKVADLLDQRHRDREAAAKKTSTSDDAKIPPTDPASQLCTA